MPPEIALHARHARPGAVRIWVGVSEQPNPPQLTWTFMTSAGGPMPQPPVTAIYGPHPVRQTAGNRIYTAIYEFSGLTPSKEYLVICNLVGAQTATIAQLTTRCAPNEIPSGAWFNILLVSCFHYSQGSPLVASTVAEARRHLDSGFDLGLFMGDQVYLDLPTFADFDSSQAWLEEEFEAAYRRNFFGFSPNVHRRGEAWTQYPSLLQAAPCVFIPDDHEYWNNFPCAQLHIETTYTHQGRLNWRNAARNLFAAFQAHDPNHVGAPLRIDLPPLSLFVADTRSHRGLAFQADPDADAFLNSLEPAALTALQQWVTDIDNNQGNLRYGLFATGQSLLDGPAFFKNVADASLANYEDYPLLLGTLLGRTTDGSPGLRNTGMLLTGDVHWGRWCVFRKNNYDKLHEVIVSPVALVSAPSLGLGDFPFPRHGKADKPPAQFPPRDADIPDIEPVRLDFWDGHPRGDQIGVLSFQKVGEDVLKVRLRYYNIYPNAGDASRYPKNPYELNFELRRA